VRSLGIPKCTGAGLRRQQAADMLSSYLHPEQADPMKDPIVREARLRGDFADRYPGIEPGIWFNAATLAEHLDHRRTRESDRDWPVGSRALSPEHFEFRGGEKPIGVRTVLGRRPED
jgi:hypothetical protein